jgi:RNA polymerase primary sigma factor
LYDALLEEFDDDAVARQPEDEEGFAAQAVVEMELEQGDDLEVVEQPGEVEVPAKLEEEDLLSELAADTESWSDDPVRMYLTQMGEIPLLTRAQEIFLAKKIEVTRRRFRTKLLECDYVIQQAFKVLKRVHEGEPTGHERERGTRKKRSQGQQKHSKQSRNRNPGRNKPK